VTPLTPLTLLNLRETSRRSTGLKPDGVAAAEKERRPASLPAASFPSSPARSLGQYAARPVTLIGRVPVTVAPATAVSEPSLLTRKPWIPLSPGVTAYR